MEVFRNILTSHCSGFFSVALCLLPSTKSKKRTRIQIARKLNQYTRLEKWYTQVKSHFARTIKRFISNVYNPQGSLL